MALPCLAGSSLTYECVADAVERMLELDFPEPLIHHVLHQHRELIHHSAEVNVLRDLYRSTWV